MYPITAFNTISKQFAKHSSDLMKLEYDINSGSAATVYIQIHDFPSAADLAAGRTAPSAGSVPLKCWPGNQGVTNNYKEFKRGELHCSNGVFVCVSTTQATLTIGTVNNKFDSVAAELFNQDLASTTEAQVTADTSLVVWANTANQNKLLRLAATNLDAAVRYLLLFASDSINNGDIPIAQWKMEATGNASGLDIIGVSFGLGTNNSKVGRTVFSQTAAAVANFGCAIAISTTANVLTSAGVTTGANFYAEYK